MTPLVYRLLLRLSPREFRDRFGVELMETAASLSRQPDRRRSWRVFRDAVATSVGLRADLRRERRMAAGYGPSPGWSTWWPDLRVALRSLAKAPAFATAAIVTLAFGIGAHTVVYAIVDGMLLRPLPFGDHGDRMVTLHSTHPTQATDWDDSELSYADLMDLRDAGATFEQIEGVLTRNFSLSTSDDAVRVTGASVTPGLFSLLGVTPQEGRVFRPEEGAAPGFEDVVILSDAMWQRLFNGDRSIVGHTVSINARPLTVVGIMPEGFGFPAREQLWVPYRADRTTGRANRAVLGIGLLKPDVTLGQATADASRVAEGLASSYPDTNREWGMAVLPLRQMFVGSSRQGLTVMLVAVSLLLLVACANVAGLMIARGTSRERELVTRSALGASRARLIRLLLTESAVIAAAGGVIGVLLSMWGLSALMSSISELPAYWAQPSIDGRVLTLSCLVTGAVALLSGLVPAWRLSRVDLSGASSSASRAIGGGRGHRRFQSGLVVTQVAMSLMLLVSGTLLSQTAVALQAADPGFDVTNIFSARFYIAGDAYDPPEARAVAVQRVAAELQQLPGVVSAAVTGSIPADDGGAVIRLRPTGALSGAAEDIGAMLIPATEGLWTTLGLSVSEGRTFLSEEIRNPEADVVIVNQRLAQLFWPGESALGRSLPVVSGAVAETMRVVGVVPDLVYEEFGETTPQSQLNVYVPYGVAGWRTLAVLVRTVGNPADVAPLVPAAVRRVDPMFATFDTLTLPERRAVTTQGERLIAKTFAAFAVVAVVLACVGIYGLISFGVAQRRREVGVRLAIGARPANILHLFLQSGVKLGALGVLVGLPLAVVAAKALAALLFHVSPWDPTVWTVLPAALLAAVLVASLVPARRACRTDAVEALRQ